MTLYKITNWQDHFENAKTRQLATMRWVPVPNKQDGDGYSELIMEHENGTAHYGAWHSVIQVASKCTPRGTLVRDTGHPHDLASLSRITRIPKEVLEEAMPRLVAIGWITSEPFEPQQVTASASPECHSSDAPGALSALEGKGMEGNGREGNGREYKGELVITGQRVSTDEINQVVARYQEHHPRAKGGQRERDLIGDRFKEGFSVEDCLAAIDGCHRSPWHCGENPGNKKFQSLDLIFRNSSNVTKFIEIPTGGPVLSESTSRSVRAATVWLEDEVTP